MSLSVSCKPESHLQVSSLQLQVASFHWWLIDVIHDGWYQRFKLIQRKVYFKPDSNGYFEHLETALKSEGAQSKVKLNFCQTRLGRYGDLQRFQNSWTCWTWREHVLHICQVGRPNVREIFASLLPLFYFRSSWFLFCPAIFQQCRASCWMSGIACRVLGTFALTMLKTTKLHLLCCSFQRIYKDVW